MDGIIISDFVLKKSKMEYLEMLFWGLLGLEETILVETNVLNFL